MQEKRSEDQDVETQRVYVCDKVCVCFYVREHDQMLENTKFCGGGAFVWVCVCLCARIYLCM